MRGFLIGFPFHADVDSRKSTKSARFFQASRRAHNGTTEGRAST